MKRYFLLEKIMEALNKKSPKERGNHIERQLERTLSIDKQATVNVSYDSFICIKTVQEKCLGYNTSTKVGAGGMFRKELSRTLYNFLAEDNELNDRLIDLGCGLSLDQWKSFVNIFVGRMFSGENLDRDEFIDEILAKPVFRYDQVINNAKYEIVETINSPAFQQVLLKTIHEFSDQNKRITVEQKGGKIKRSESQDDCSITKLGVLENYGQKAMFRGNGIVSNKLRKLMLESVEIRREQEKIMQEIQQHRDRLGKVAAVVKLQVKTSKSISFSERLANTDVSKLFIALKEGKADKVFADLQKEQAIYGVPAVVDENNNNDINTSVQHVAIEATHNFVAMINKIDKRVLLEFIPTKEQDSVTEQIGNTLETFVQDIRDGGLVYALAERGLEELKVLSDIVLNIPPGEGFDSDQLDVLSMVTNYTIACKYAKENDKLTSTLLQRSSSSIMSTDLKPCSFLESLESHQKCSKREQVMAW